MGNFGKINLAEKKFSEWLNTPKRYFLRDHYKARNGKGRPRKEDYIICTPSHMMDVTMAKLFYGDAFVLTDLKDV